MLYNAELVLNESDHPSGGPGLVVCLMIISFASTFEIDAIIWMLCECFCIKHTTNYVFIFLYFPVCTFLHFPEMLPALHRISDFFIVTEFSVKGAMPSSFAL
jgi:hypothetical protein